MNLTETEKRTLARAAKILEREAQYENMDPITNPIKARELVLHRIAGEQQEKFLVLFLSNQHHLIRSEILFTGTIDGAAVYPREIIRRSLELNAAAIIIAHNHPSGVVEPSRADRAITERIKQACGTMDIRLLDHIIVGHGKRTCSFSESGFL